MIQDTPEPFAKGRRTKKDEALWLLSFSDLCLVLLSFFILMISVMSPNKQKMENVKSGLNQDLVQHKVETLENLSQKVTTVINKENLQNDTSVTFDAEGLRIEFKENLLFRSGSAETNTQQAQLTAKVLAAVARIGANNYRLIIEGHTDDVPLREGGKFGSNWELSAARGFSLMRLFHNLGVKEDKVSVVSYAQTRPKVKVEGLKGADLAKARAANRRVVIRVE